MGQNPETRIMPLAGNIEPSNWDIVGGPKWRQQIQDGGVRHLGEYTKGHIWANS